MRPALLLVSAILLGGSSVPHQGGIFLAGERVRFNDDLTVRLTPRQIANTADATRAGLARFAATDVGRHMIAWFTENDCVVDVFEDASEGGAGSAPQPGIATLVADRGAVRTYELILNPSFPVVPRGMHALPTQPATAADLMAAAWGAEALHVYFYAQGISLPHHERADFQEEWGRLAVQLGFPGLPHGEDEHTQTRSPRRAGRGWREAPGEGSRLPR